MNHIKDDLFLRYTSNLASETEQLQVDTHLAECQNCRDRLSALIYLQENLESILKTWSAKEHGRLYHRWQILRTLHSVANSSPDLSARLWRYLDQGKSSFKVTVNLLVDQARRVATAAAGSLPEDFDCRLRPAFAGVGSPAELARVEKHLKSGSNFLSRGDTKAAIKNLQEAARIDVRSSQSAILEMHRDKDLIMQVTADSRRNRIWVRYFPKAEKPLPELALLVPASPENSPYAAEFKPVNGEDNLLAEFESVTGDLQTLLIVFEPERI